MKAVHDVFYYNPKTRNISFIDLITDEIAEIFVGNIESASAIAAPHKVVIGQCTRYK